MCRTVHALLQTGICGIQMLVRVFMTIILMLENLIRMILQTLYNFISFMLQMISLIPICLVFLLTSRLKCFMCGGGGACPVARGGTCDCLMSFVAILILFLIFRATGVLDKLFYHIGYTKYRPQAVKFVPTPGDITECSRNESETTATYEITTTETTTTDTTEMKLYYEEETTTDAYYWFYYTLLGRDTTLSTTNGTTERTTKQRLRAGAHRRFRRPTKTRSTKKWTTVLYYLV
ncbi:unnamed protein product [Diatraea saccharalis]|uniref:Uncharacterized protein n=1 Tax=Diatraea saccharalis TaxID=40085 RepID=A0A9N9QWV8_9NEOP|nr:unnamed protein product [Diatraea saccharalis]